MFPTQTFNQSRQCPAHQRLGLGQPVRVLEQHGQVVEADGDVGVLGAEALLVDRQRAAHQRLGLGQAVRGLKQLGQVVEVDGDTLGCSGPKLFSSIASARRISGSASARRLVSWSNWRQVVEVTGDLGVIGAEALLVDRQRPAHQRLGLGQAVRGLKQQRQVVEV